MKEISNFADYQKENMPTTEFESLPLNIQQIKIAQDVLEQVKLGKYLAKQRVYVQFDWIEVEDITVGEDVQSTLHLLPTCEVCAYGSMMLSAIRFKNSVNWDENALYYGCISQSNFRYTKPLKELFNEGQLTLIENAFEGWDEDEEAVEDSAIMTFYHKFDNPTARLIAIMENLITNNGEFVL